MSTRKTASSQQASSIRREEGCRCSRRPATTAPSFLGQGPSHHADPCGLMEPKDLKVQPCGQLQREEHQVSLGQPIDQQGRREQGLLRNQGAEGFGLDHSPFFRPDRLLSLLLEQISSRLSRGCVGGGLYATRSSSKALQRSNSSTPDWYSVHGSIFIALPSLIAVARRASACNKSSTSSPPYNKECSPPIQLERNRRFDPEEAPAALLQVPGTWCDELGQRSRPGHPLNPCPDL